MIKVNTKGFYSLNKLIFIPIVFLLLQSCFSVKPGVKKSGKKLYETFYIGEEGMQYFIKPILLSNKEDDEELKIDFTFRYKDIIRDSAIVNFSVYSNVKPKTLDSLRLKSTSSNILNTDIEILYKDKKKDVYVYRYSTKIELKKVINLFEFTTWELNLYFTDDQKHFISGKKSSKNISILNEVVFDLIKE